MPTRNINLTEHFDRFVADQVEGGGYRNASEVMRAALRLLEQQTREDEHKLKRLRALATDAFAQIDQGQGTELTSDHQVATFIHKVGQRAAAAQNRRSKGA